ncbi:uncharacterized protein SAPINGB_P001436 [Magnusiomyces paraingens]|uniref:NADP-dependent oxidoreductase domain-containing protein n=1 Tax=Magnusiomyces paraingens TaxID=2606893 RepID=A0A5E8B5Q5_9ASCO|nr:uncharacterized protein SAPINGB_P001436 [Saprochaete ingens]VVT46885.1 unnamed protein product [Saprochaete ingens]
MTAIPEGTLSNGVKIPFLAFGVGTVWSKWRLRTRGVAIPETGIYQPAVDVVLAALRAGHRHIDTAEFYETEEEVGLAIEQFLKETPSLSRKDIFITTKVWKYAADPDAAIAESLRKLRVDYIDLYLIHSPDLPKFNAKIEVVWPKLEEFYKQGKARAIGVSNFSVKDLEYLRTFAKVTPHANQIEYSPYQQDPTPGLVEYLHKNNILIEAYGPLGAITVENYETAPLTPVLERLTKKYNKSPAQISLRWVYQTNVLPVTTSSKTDRLKESLDIFSFSLSDDEVSEITTVSKAYQYHRYPSSVTKP